MHKGWYYHQIEECIDTFAEQWEVLTLEKWHLSYSAGFTVQQLKRDLVLSWAKSKSRDLTLPELASTGNLIPHPRLLITRLSRYKSLEAKPRFIPFSKHLFNDIAKKLALPPEFTFARIHGGASGFFSLHTLRDPFDKVTKIEFTMRVPHAPRNEIKSVWSLGLSWDAKTQLTTGIFDGASDFDTELLLANLNALPKEYLGHPLLIPHLLLQQLVVYYNKGRSRFGKDLFSIERRFGLTSGHMQRNPWSWGQNDFQDITHSLSDVNTGLIYAERRLSFAHSLAKYLQDNNAIVESQLDSYGQLRRTLNYFQEDLRNILPFLDNQLHQISCLQKRSQLLTNSVYSIIAQKDNTTNIQIGMAAKHDSTSMMTIAFVTITFLPATFVSSIFGTNFFAFNPSQPRILMTNNFWIYWVITIPLTVMVIAIWRIWMHYQVKPFDNSLRPAVAGGFQLEKDQSYDDRDDNPYYSFVPVPV